MSEENVIQVIPVRASTIGKDTPIKRAVPTAKRRRIGAWVFLDHIGPTFFEAGAGLDVGPHPHTGLQTFTWMIEGELVHTDSLGYKQVIAPGQINLMTAGYGISHTEVSPEDFSGITHAVQFWIAQPEGRQAGQSLGASDFQHYPEVPVCEKDGVTCRLLVGDFLEHVSKVKVATPLVGVDIRAEQGDAQTALPLRADFEYGLLLLKGEASLDGQALDQNHLLYFPEGQAELKLTLEAGAHLVLIGGEPFKEPIIVWWNLITRTSEEIHEAVEQWQRRDARFGDIPDYKGKSLIAPEIPDKFIAS